MMTSAIGDPSSNHENQSHSNRAGYGIRCIHLGGSDHGRDLPLLSALLGSCRCCGGPTSRSEADIQTLYAQLQIYKASNGSFPSEKQGIQALVTRPSGDPQPHKWRKILDAVPVDSWGNSYQLRNPATRSKDPIDLFSMGPDRLPGTADDIGSW